MNTNILHKTTNAIKKINEKVKARLNLRKPNENEAEYLMALFKEASSLTDNIHRLLYSKTCFRCRNNPPGKVCTKPDCLCGDKWESK